MFFYIYIFLNSDLFLGVAGSIRNGVTGTWPVWSTTVEVIFVIAGIVLASYGVTLRRPSAVVQIHL